MNHWFDDLTRGLARGTITRRAMLRSALNASLGAAGALLLGRSVGMTQMVLANGEGQREEGSCTRRQEGHANVLNLSAKSTFKGKPLTFEQTSRKEFPKGETTISKIIRGMGPVSDASPARTIAVAARRA